jgi:hypothetical protein
LTDGDDGRRIPPTADYFVIPAPCPCSVALFSCRCGATAVDYDLKDDAPPGWETAEDGELLCPVCAAKASETTG